MAATQRYLIGVDGGTESIRAGVFTVKGEPLAFHAVPYATQYPEPGWAEQNPADWYAALGVAVQNAVKEAGVAGADIAAICLDTTCCTVVALDNAGRALRPALLWMDMRSAGQAQQVAGANDEALLVNAAGTGAVSAEWMVPKALWLKQNEPSTFDEATYICEYQDYLNYHLTGRMCASMNNVSVRWHYSSARGGYPVSLLQKLNLSELLEKWPKDVLELGATVGGLTDAAAAHLGLPAGLPVAQGGADAFIGMIGLGVINAGELALLTGSSHLHLGITGAPVHGAGMWGSYADALVPRLHVVEGGQTSTGSVINWYKKLFGGQVGYDELNAEAAAVQAGCEGLIALDHFQGNRTPHTDAHSRGALIGLTLKHTRGHIFRALMESVCYGTALILETMRGHGVQPTEIVLAGGASRSPLWLQIHADTCGVPLRLTRVADAPALGSAVLAAVAAGLYPSIAAACGEMVHVEQVVRPRPTAHSEYRAHYEAYKQLYHALKPLHHRNVEGQKS